MDRLEEQLRATLADERLALPPRPDATNLVKAGVRRRRRNRAIATVASAIVLVGGGIAGASLVNRGGGNDRIVPPTGGSKPTAPAVEEVPWADTAYDYRHQPAMPGTVADPSVPWCRASQLSLSDQTRAADVKLLVDNTVTNVSASSCALQGQPTASVHAGSQLLLSSPAPEPFYVNEWVRLDPQQQAHVQVIWGDQYCGRAAPTSIVLSLPHSGGTVSAPLTHAPGCNSTNLADNGQLDVAGFVSTTSTPFTPLAGLQASLDRVSAATIPGGTVTYRLQLQSTAAQQVALTPCLPYRERLVDSTTGNVLVEEDHLLNCAGAPSSIADAHSGRLTYFDLRIAVPADATPGSYALLWQSVLKPVNAYPDTDVRVGPTPPCRDGQIVASDGKQAHMAAMNQYGHVLVLRNASATPCTLRGYPGLRLVDAAGQPLGKDATRGRGFVFPDPGPTTVVLPAVTGTASFTFGGGAINATDGKPCPTSVAAIVYPPGLRHQLRVPLAEPDCESGITVTAVIAGSRGPRS